MVSIVGGVGGIIIFYVLSFIAAALNLKSIFFYPVIGVPALGSIWGVVKVIKYNSRLTLKQENK